MQRTVPAAERITSVSVSMVLLRNLTPRSIEPFVTPVAPKAQSPRQHPNGRVTTRVEDLEGVYILDREAHDVS
jgi:hypothetical protein